MGVESPSAEQDPRYEANTALDDVVKEMSNQGLDLTDFQDHITAVRQAIRNPNNEANSDLDALQQKLGELGSDLQALGFSTIRSAIKER